MISKDFTELCNDLVHGMARQEIERQYTGLVSEMTLLAKNAFMEGLQQSSEAHCMKETADRLSYVAHRHHWKECPQPDKSFLEQFATVLCRCYVKGRILAKDQPLNNPFRNLNTCDLKETAEPK